MADWGIVCAVSAESLSSLDDEALAAAVRPAALLPLPPSLEHEMRHALAQLWSSGDFSDCRLADAEGNELDCHRIVLWARSEHFRQLFGPTARSHTPVRLVIEAHPLVLRAALAHVYLDEPPEGLSHAEMLELRGIARDWKLDALLHQTAIGLIQTLATDTVCTTLAECAREESRARLAGAEPHKSTLLLKEAAGAFAAARFRVLRDMPQGADKSDGVARRSSECVVEEGSDARPSVGSGGDMSQPTGTVCVSKLLSLPSSMRVWIFTKRSPLPLHLVAAGGAEGFMEAPAIVQALMGPPYMYSLDHVPNEAEVAAAGGAFARATPLAVALSRHDWDLCDLFLDMGASLGPATGRTKDATTHAPWTQDTSDPAKPVDELGHIPRGSGIAGTGRGAFLLHAASAAADEAAVAYLLRRGAGVNDTDSAGRTPLDMCVMASLWTSGPKQASVDSRTPSGEVGLTADEGRADSEPEVEERLADVSALGDTTASSSGTPASTAHARVAALLRSSGGDSQYRVGGQLLVHRMAAAGATSQLGMLLKGGPRGVADSPNAAGVSPLALAVLHGHLAAAELLLQHGARPSALHAGGGPAPIHLAAKRSSVELVQLLLEHGAPLQMPMPGSGETPLHLAAQQPGDCVALLLSYGAELEARDSVGLTALQHAVCGVAPLQACQELLKAGASPNTADYHLKRTPLHRLCEFGAVEMDSADCTSPDTPSKESLPPNGSTASPASRPTTPQTPSCASSQCKGADTATATLRLLLDAKAIVNVQDADGATPLHLACSSGRLALALELMASGASPNVPDRYGLCPLSSVDPPPVDIRRGRALLQAERLAILRAIVTPPPWLPDHLASSCQVCSLVFTSSNRRHHCRHCGRIVCGGCSGHRLSLEKFGVAKPSRVCSECHSALVSGKGFGALPRMGSGDFSGDAPMSTGRASQSSCGQAIITRHAEEPPMPDVALRARSQYNPFDTTPRSLLTIHDDVHSRMATPARTPNGGVSRAPCVIAQQRSEGTLRLTPEDGIGGRAEPENTDVVTSPTASRASISDRSPCGPSEAGNPFDRSAAVRRDIDSSGWQSPGPSQAVDVDASESLPCSRGGEQIRASGGRGGEQGGVPKEASSTWPPNPFAEERPSSSSVDVHVRSPAHPRLDTVHAKLADDIFRVG